MSRYVWWRHLLCFVLANEFLSIQRDPGQLHNYFTNASPEDTYSIAGRTFSHILNRLDALMMVLKSCKARECTHPWEVLHPAGNVRSLIEALEETFDAFYEEQPKVAFNTCQLGHLKNEEGPQNVNAYEGPVTQSDAYGPALQKTFRYAGHWSIWT